MKNHNKANIVATGLGITSAIGQGKSDFLLALLKGEQQFAVMQRPGRQVPKNLHESGTILNTSFLGAEISNLRIPDSFSSSLLRTASFSSQVAAATLYEAWNDAYLDEIDPERIGLVVGGSNLQQRELSLTHDRYRSREQFLRPTYGLSFLDSDICGLCTELFGIKGFAYTLGSASASGQVAVLQAIQAVKSGQVDVCIAVGGLMDISYWECQGLRSLGAMGSDRFSAEPTLACRPFDKDRDGFIYGESCGVVVIERDDLDKRSGVKPYARLSGMAMGVDANRNPNPSLRGEINVIKNALQDAGLTAKDIDYLNPHGSGSSIGDEIELQAIRSCQLGHAYINATKSITGHGLSAAGIVEIIATLLQMKEGIIHPTLNLDTPIESGYNWVRQDHVSHVINNALNLSFGFGGINSALCLQNYTN